MNYRQLGHTDIRVSELGLGTMTWGKQNTEAEAFEQMDYAVEHGINLFDAAELYPVPPEQETQGRTEEYIGNWLKQRGKRDDIVIASKFCAQAEWVDYLRGGNHKADRANIETALNDSLSRLKTDYLDLYQIHWPERDTNFFGKLGYYHAPDKDGVAIEETLDALDEIVKSGKVRHIGISNETAWGIHEYLRLSSEKNQARIVSIQNPYNLLNRSFEVGMAEFAHREQVGLLAYSPMAFGALSGKYLGEDKPADGRLTLFSRFSRYTNELGIKATQQYAKLAEDSGLDLAQMALAYVTSRPFVTSNLIGATKMEQLKSNIASKDIQLSKDVLRAIEEIHSEIPNPCP